jgi:hypothetical protein
LKDAGNIEDQQLDEAEGFGSRSTLQAQDSFEVEVPSG